MILYRAMCEQEAQETIKNLQPSFIKRFKWFSTNVDFIKNRVLDKNFNNSCGKETKYYRIFMFELQNTNSADWIKKDEVQIDRRNNAKISFIKEITNELVC